MEESSGNPYGKIGGNTAKQIIDKVLNQNFRNKGNGVAQGEKSIGEMEDEIMELVHKHVKFLE